jgi:hypothetical protein
MTVETYLLTLTAGAAALALWAFARFPAVGPRRPVTALAHLTVALLAAWLAAPLIASVAGAGGPALGLIVIALPALTYVFLAGAWLARAAQWPHGDGDDRRAGRGLRP